MTLLDMFIIESIEAISSYIYVNRRIKVKELNSGEGEKSIAKNAL